ncbi:MAG TPA: Arc family DNA-binding protein [Bryobacteraceae bacterium]|nr:Arc family DNA-binding protein [Bryobacteraceae bacterium]
MAQRKAFPLRLDPVVHDALQRWADAELRSVNAQIEFVLRQALQKAGRLPAAEAHAKDRTGSEEAAS